MYIFLKKNPSNRNWTRSIIVSRSSHSYGATLSTSSSSCLISQIKSALVAPRSECSSLSDPCSTLLVHPVSTWNKIFALVISSFQMSLPVYGPLLFLQIKQNVDFNQSPKAGIALARRGDIMAWRQSGLNYGP